MCIRDRHELCGPQSLSFPGTQLSVIKKKNTNLLSLTDKRINDTNKEKADTNVTKKH